MNPGTQGTTASARLEVDDVTVRFGGLTALAQVSLQVAAGSVVGVIGPNGAGKTTLFNVICGFTRAQSGRLLLDGQPIVPAPHQLGRLGIARTLQGLGLFQGLSVLDNVMAGIRWPRRTSVTAGLLGLPHSDRRERADRERALTVLDELGIVDRSAALPQTLPYALAKRVALARALVAEPRLLLLDEPAGGLGGDDIDELAGLIRSVPRRDGTASVVLVEHHVDLVMQVCDHVVVLDFGEVISSGPPSVVKNDPAVIEAYLGAEIEKGAP